MLCCKARREPMQSRNSLQLEFLEQCMLGDELKVRNMLNSHMVDTSYHHPVNGWTALHWAARRGHTNICLLLLESGFSEELKDRNNKTPWEVCSEDNTTLREILRPPHCDEEAMSEALGKRRCSAGSNQNTRFVPNYIRHPPFPYSKAASFDNGTIPGSPTTNGPGLYSYGRRDSVNRTRFLLVRTCCADGKEAFKRVTLPGGSTLAQLKKMIEKSMRNGEVKSIVTLPDRVLVEDDSQIAQFADCQKVEVVYVYSTTTTEILQPVKEQPIDPIAPTKNAMETEAGNVPQEEKSGEGAEHGDNYPITLVEPFSEQTSDVGNITMEDNSSNEGYSLTTPAEVDPSTTPADTEENGNQVEVDSGHKISLRKSVDSDPGDFVKIDRADNGSTEEKPATDTVESKEAPKATPPAEQQAVKEEEKKDVEEKKSEEERVQEPPKDKTADKKSQCCSGLMLWMNENPDMVRCAATAAAVLGVAGLAGLVYARKVRSSGL